MIIGMNSLWMKAIIFMTNIKQKIDHGWIIWVSLMDFAQLNMK